MLYVWLQVKAALLLQCCLNVMMILDIARAWLLGLRMLYAAWGDRLTKRGKGP